LEIVVTLSTDPGVATCAVERCLLTAGEELFDRGKYGPIEYGLAIGEQPRGPHGDPLEQPEPCAMWEWLLKVSMLGGPI
jgi:hypothetical protein